ncbi:MAG: D-cysteine desulfhydrase family protein [Bacteroidales bacterium]|nr:D-cysteine desulfhydrase family protein [Bacteroidales bacterium]
MKKFKLGFFPTPLYKLNNFSQLYPDYQVFIKRDDHTGLASGGNKTRKLEYLIGEALSEGANSVITAGAQQSNHCRQTAAACAMAGLECHLLLRGDPPDNYTGNLLLSKLLGAKLHFSKEDKKGPGIPKLAETLKQKGLKPYIIPYGGSNFCGAMGYVEAAAELKQQLMEQDLNIDYIFFASSSGGMQIGLTLGNELYNLNCILMPVCIDKEEQGATKLEDIMLGIINTEKHKLNIHKNFSKDDVTLLRQFNEPGYGVVTDHEREAMKALAETEGILLDPVYTGRAFYAMMHFLKHNMLKPGSNVLFWHTGGLPANFYYAEQLS